MTTATAFSRHDPRLGEVSLRPLDLPREAALLQRWVTHAKAAFWLMQDATAQQVLDEYRRIQAHPHHEALLGLVDGRACFLAERYDPAHVELFGLYDGRPGDVGMHFLVAPADGAPVPGFTRAVITTVVAWVFADDAAERVVVEPDVRNHAVHALNAAVGFQVHGVIRKPEKEALLSTCTRAQFRAATGVPC